MCASNPLQVIPSKQSYNSLLQQCLCTTGSGRPASPRVDAKSSLQERCYCSKVRLRLANSSRFLTPRVAAYLMRICAECGGGSFELDEQEQLFCAHCGSVSIETQLAIDVGDESVLLSGSRRRLRRFQRENDGGKRIRKEDINTSRKRSRGGSKEKERLRSGVERAQQAASLVQSTLQSEANTFFNYLSFHLLQKEDHESMRRQYLDTLRATWVGYVETYIWLFDSRFLPSEKFSVALSFMVARDILRLPVTHEIVTAWMSRRQQSNVRRGTLTRDMRIASTYDISRHIAIMFILRL